MLVSCVLLLLVVEWSAKTAFEYVLPEYPAQKNIYRTSEFDAVASINIFGFRGVERQVARGQIVTIGNSSTFGWGVNDQDTWQAALALKLQSKGMPFSVYNLGRPGADPYDYLDIARTYIPVLKPRLVIIAILQGEDPGQLLERLNTTNLYQYLKWRARNTLPGLSRAANALRFSFEGWETHSDISWTVTADWPEVSARLISAENLKFPEDIAKMALSGNLNPGLLRLAGRYPRYYVAPYEPGTIVRVERRMREILGQIATMSKAHGGSIILLSMPHNIYFDSTRHEIISGMGFELPAPRSCVMDNLVERLARSLNVGFMTLTNELRQLPSRDDLWFKYDGHLTATGTHMVADYLDTRIAGIMGGDVGGPTEVPYFEKPCSVTPLSMR